MTNQQLVDYIRQQMRQGRTNEQIRASLAPSGWSASDIDEGFNAVGVQAKQELTPVRNKKILKLCLTVFFLAVIAGAGFFVIQKTDIINNPGAALEQITSLWPYRATPLATTEGVTPSTPADNFLDSLTTCTAYTGTFEHPLTGDNLERTIVGMLQGKCDYQEKLPNGGTMECRYSESMRVAIAQYYRDGVGEDPSKTYIVDGKTVTNPIKESADTGACVI